MDAIPEQSIIHFKYNNINIFACYRLFEVKEPIKEPYFQDKIKLAVSAVDESLPPRQVIIKSYRRLNSSIGKLESSEFELSSLSDSTLTSSERKGTKNNNNNDRQPTDAYIHIYIYRLLSTSIIDFVFNADSLSPSTPHENTTMKAAQYTGTYDSDAWSLFTILPFLFGLLIINLLQVRNLLFSNSNPPFEFIAMPWLDIN